MDIHVINLDRSADRWRSFEAVNRATDARFTRFPAADGRAPRRAALAAQGLITADLDYTDGAIGNALSHFKLWDAAIERDRALTVVEDDAVLSRNFAAATETLLKGLGDAWDMVYWGWNFDSILTFDLIPGVSPCVATFCEGDLRNGIAAFRAADVRPLLFRLYAAFGILCYSVSPRGARALKALALPLRNKALAIPGLPQPVPNRDLSVWLNDFLPRIKAYVAFPPLAVTPNEPSRSTVLPREDIP